MAKYKIKSADNLEYSRNTQTATTDDGTNGGGQGDLNSRKPNPLTGEKMNEVKQVETLARYDDFADLRIKMPFYAQRGKYGIPFKPSVHRNESNPRIRDYQEQAARLFLSDLRGFGLLADCVGSGKTYEACVVISELAVRGIVENMLLIVPDPLCEKWKRVFELEFGFGAGKLQLIKDIGDIKKIETTEGGFRRPVGAFIMTYSAFKDIRNTEIESYLFDLIVVDEAHNLCEQRDGTPDSMYRLSKMMQIKKRAEKAYCLLLTATPHSGNLANMFNLWYFIRRKGGIPECFKKDGRPTEREKAEYNKEKKYYFETVCKGATTVAEYVAKAECEFLEGMEGTHSDVRDKYLSPFEVTIDAGDRGRRIRKPGLTWEEYKKLKDCEKRSRAQAFLRWCERHGPGSPEYQIKQNAIDAVNRFYTNTVMRSIMVRRRNSFVLVRNAFSYFFLPVKERVSFPVQPPVGGSTPFLKVDGSCYYTLEGVDSFFSQTRAVRALFDDNPYFRDRNSLGEEGFSDYYDVTIKSILANAASLRDFIRVEQVPCGSDAEMEEAVFRAKCERFVSLLREIRGRKKSSQDEQEPQKRVIVFFDYEKAENEEAGNENSTGKRLLRYLNENATDLAADVIEGRSDMGVLPQVFIEKYSQNPNGILFAEDQTFTEGLDLQNGNVVINFEVPIDPLAVDQRIGRVYRMGQAAKQVEIYSFANMTRLDGYCLGYFARIGILSDVQGDATILSGCNSDSMVVVRCPSCNEVSMMLESDYEESLRTCEQCGGRMVPTRVSDSDSSWEECYVCTKNPTHRVKVEKNNPLRCELCEDAPVRELITFSEFVCPQNKLHRIRRSKENDYAYLCMSREKKIMWRDSDCKTTNLVGCSKLCAVKNCRQKPSDCLITEETDEGNARVICLSCRHRDNCMCNTKISVANSCMDCNCSSSFRCGTKPYVIDFGADYKSGKCPYCGVNLLQIKPNSFETFIRERYERDRCFAKNFLGEAQNTLTIKEIIKFNND
ncbi:MAG: DEAD/DEAH box helicase family protein [Clostridia bacterium]|nr:DEAD/DEAH box helicase family protein [Clostridia bacterium]